MNDNEYLNNQKQIFQDLLEATIHEYSMIPGKDRGDITIGAHGTVLSFRNSTKGILAGVILAVGRVVGETAALVYTAGTVADFPKGIFSSGRTLSVHMYELSREGFHTGEAYATSVILILVILLINWISNKFAKKIGKT